MMDTVMMAPMDFTLTEMNSVVMRVTATMHAVFVMVMIRPALMNAAYQMVTTHPVPVVMVCLTAVLKMTTVVSVMVIM